jgi:hypothetical protein
MGGLGKALALHHLDEGAHGGYLIHIPLSVDNYFNKSMIIHSCSEVSMSGIDVNPPMKERSE